MDISKKWVSACAEQSCCLCQALLTLLLCSWGHELVDSACMLYACQAGRLKLMDVDAEHKAWCCTDSKDAIVRLQPACYALSISAVSSADMLS